MKVSLARPCDLDWSNGRWEISQEAVRHTSSTSLARLGGASTPLMEGAMLRVSRKNWNETARAHEQVQNEERHNLAL